MRLFVNSEFEDEVRYFTYLPPSDKFQLAINLKSYTFGMPYSLSLKQLSLQKIPSTLRRNLIIDNSPWWTKYEKNGFDLTFHSNQSGIIGGMDLLKVIPVQMEYDQDIILMKLEMNKGPSNSKAEMELTFSGSEI